LPLADALGDMFGTSGVRGTVGEAVTAELALSIGRALGAETGAVVVGRDARESGATLTDALAAGLCECGTDVVDLGVATTPTVARAVPHRGADAGVVVTASHNPPTDNGLKLWDADGRAFGGADRERIAERVRAADPALAAWDGQGRRRDRGDGAATAAHRDALVGAVDLPESPRVVVDVGNGTGGVTAAALDDLGCRVETLHAQPDGAFPGRPSEPTADNCETLQRVVANTPADLGIAHDGDADRTMAVDAAGRFRSGDELLALFGRAAAAAAGVADPVVAAPLNTSLAVDDALAEVGATLARTRVGDTYVAERASDPAVVFGGEPSGAWIWPDAVPCPDGPLAACKLAELVAREGPLADQVAAAVPDYPIRRDAIETDAKAAVMARLTETVRERYDDVETLDGVRVDLGDAWFLVRASGTQPLVRITAEARDADHADAVFDEANSLVEGAR
jgi:phosphoglucosamine mutase